MRILNLVLVAIWFTCAAGTGAPADVAMQEQLRADWEWRDQASDLKVNPTGEIQGAATWDDATGAVDGKKTGSYGFHTIFSTNPWWHVDLGKPFELDHLIIYNRDDGGCSARALGMVILVSLDGRDWKQVFQHTDEHFGGARDGKPLRVDLKGQNVTARWVRCMVPKQVSFHLDEVEIYPADDPTKNVALGRPADQSSAGRSSTPKNAGSRPRENAFQLDATADVLKRAGELLSRLSEMDDDDRAGQARELRRVEAELKRLELEKSTSAGQRRDVYFQAMAASREVALSNPLLDFNSLLFVKRNPGALAHMCDQYFGSLSRAGGGLFVLDDIKGAPRLRDLIGDQLPLGSFLGPDLSFDGKRIVFAYAKADPSRKSLRWDGSPELSYHVYTINADGTDLRRLTEGRWDDIHPCWLPDGDIVFMSTRRGGETRCSGRPVPTYTLHRMKPDGSAITRLSSHETHEWHPSIAPDGSLLYTRWDYVDRHTNISHSLWTCRTDGSAPVAVYGNYNFNRKPWGIWHARAIPGSNRIMATAGAHHGYASGSVISIDPFRDFDGQDPLERLTPEVSFPEAEGYSYSAYNTPYPLSEDFFLVAYSPAWSTHTAQHQVTMGIYLADRWGNRTLLYRDEKIASQGAIPVRPRAVLPTYPAPAESAPEYGNFLVLNSYGSTQPFPDARVKSLRIVQVLPKTTYAADQPKMSVARQISARQVIGEVPVDADGSAHFRVQAGIPVYFQALDEDRMAIQTMRSITYLQPGETRSCVGCHEPRQATPATRRPTASMRQPSIPEPGPDGTKPFSYIRLVQPVLDRHCIGCHAPGKQADKLLLTGEFSSEKNAFTRSYEALAKKKFVPWFDSINGGEWVPQSTPGKLGARSSALVAMLQGGHHDVKLPAEDLYRLSLWVDLNVPFYGCYEPKHVAMQRAGEVAPLAEMLQ